jgi:hypothetical protein
MLVVSRSFRLAISPYCHWPRDTVSNDASHTAAEEELISVTTRTLIFAKAGVMKSVDVCTQAAVATVLDGTDCAEKMVA